MGAAPFCLDFDGLGDVELAVNVPRCMLVAAVSPGNRDGGERRDREKEEEREGRRRFISIEKRRTPTLSRCGQRCRAAWTRRTACTGPMTAVRCLGRRERTTGRENKRTCRQGQQNLDVDAGEEAEKLHAAALAHDDEMHRAVRQVLRWRQPSP